MDKETRLKEIENELLDRGFKSIFLKANYELLRLPHVLVAFTKNHTEIENLKIEKAKLEKVSI